MKIIVTDIETNGLLDTVSKFHCAYTYDRVTGEWIGYRPDDFADYVKAIEMKAAEGYLIAFHNGIGYDWRALKILKKSLLGSDLNLPKQNIFDTLVAARLVFSNIKDSDFARARSGKLSGKLIGSHSLDAWGQRLGVLKGNHVAPAQDADAWEHFTEEMFTYCKQDVVVTNALLDYLFSNKWYFENSSEMALSLRLEHQAQWTVTNIIQNGFPFNEDKADRLYQDLLVRRSELLHILTETFGSWYQPAPTTGDQWLINTKTGKSIATYPRVYVPKQGELTLESGKWDTRDTWAGAPLTRVKLVKFNPASRAHIIRVLKLNGWEPTEFTDAGNPKVDDEVLEGVRVDNPEAQKCIELIREYLMVQKRCSQLAEGKQAWMKHVKDGKIHGYINSNGAVTGRATHSFPNMSQVPAVNKPYGKECRELFGAENMLTLEGTPWIQVGTDASGLELRCLGHFMYPFDNGEYVHEVVSGDIHTKNQMAAGLPTRDNAKTFIYGFLYGAGDAKIGSIVGKGSAEGKELKAKFLEATPALKALRDTIVSALVESKKYDPVTKKFNTKWKRKYIVGLDGRQVHVRSDHSSLNTLLQSAGALICKAWIVEVERQLEETHGLTQGWDGDFCLMAWSHDELQIAARTDAIAEIVVKASKDAMGIVEKKFSFRAPLDVESKIGNNWAVCH